MAKLCNSCGQSLPREDSRFCNRCGAILSQDVSPASGARRTQVFSDERSSSVPGMGSASFQPALREQIAFAPSLVSTDDVPPWLGKLETMGNRPNAARPQPQNVTLPTPQVENPSSNAVRPFSPGRSRLPQRELRIKVWEDGDAEIPDLTLPDEHEDNPRQAIIVQDEQSEEPTQSLPDQPQESGEVDSEVEDLPTTPMPSASIVEQDGKPFSSVARNGHVGNAQQDAQVREDVDLPTLPLPAHTTLPAPAPNRASGRPFPAQAYRRPISPQPVSDPQVDRQQPAMLIQGSAHPMQAPIVQRPVTPALPTSYSGFAQAMPAPAPVANEGIAGPIQPVRRKSKLRLVVVLVMLLVLVGSGLAYWIIAFEPFSVPAVTTTSLPFSNSSLGIALQYPRGWTVQLHTDHSMVVFSDVNAIDQVKIIETATNGLGLTAFLNKEVAQFGLTAAKNLAPLPFAGTSWRQVQGSVLIGGATDIETVLVAMHGTHFYTLAQIAPSAKGATYADVDHIFFSLFRSTFQFL